MYLMKICQNGKGGIRLAKREAKCGEKRTNIGINGYAKASQFFFVSAEIFPVMICTAESSMCSLFLQQNQ